MDARSFEPDPILGTSCSTRAVSPTTPIMIMTVAISKPSRMSIGSARNTISAPGRWRRAIRSFFTSAPCTARRLIRGRGGGAVFRRAGSVRMSVLSPARGAPRHAIQASAKRPVSVCARIGFPYCGHVPPAIRALNRLACWALPGSMKRHLLARRGRR